MTTRTRAAAALGAGLALFALAGPLLAGPLGNQGYAPSNSYGAASGYGAPASDAPAGPAAVGCSTCATPVAASNHPGHKVSCPPPYSHVYEGPPCLKFKKGCPRPVCDPCELPHFGYFQTCWTPWPYPRDFRHCPYPTPSDVLPPPPHPPFSPKISADRDSDADREPKKGKKKGEDNDDGPARPRKPEQLGPPDKLEKEPSKPEKDKNTQGTNIMLHGPNVRLVPQ
jgi:hypothetical protein